MFRFRFKSVLAAVVCVAAASSLQAILPPSSEGIATKTLRTPGLSPSADLVVADASALAGLGVQQGRAFRDARTGGWGTLILSEPLLSGAADSRQAAAALYGFVADHAAELEIEPAELETEPRVTVHDGGALVQIHARRVISGILVRDTELSAVLNRGNLVLFGLRNWADAPSSVQPAVSSAVAKTALAAHLAPYAPSSYLRAPRLELVPFTNGGSLSYRLVWVFTPRFSGSQGGWEGLVDAASGQVLAFRDTNHYAVSQRSVIGAVLPVSNDNVIPDGIEQPDFPMPFADLTEFGTQRKVTTDSGGNAPVCMEGPMFMQFDSQYVKMVDTCGAAPVVPTTEDTLDLGIAGYPTTDPHLGTNCALVTSPTSSAVPGNTRASRSGFYEVNRLKEQARGQLPDNGWLQDQLTANMNIPGACNAFWNGSTINFYPDTAACRNTGEIAAVFDHEWGHGMDANGARPGVSSPGESIADMFANVRLAQSCTGRGFVRIPPESPVQLGCGHGYGDPCTSCAGGIRDSDFLKHESQQPHDVAWSIPACAPDPDDQLGPCGGETHCEGTFVAEAVWDLMSRDLRCQGSGWTTGGSGNVGGGRCARGAPSRDFPTALELATKLTYLGGGFVGEWFQCKVDGTAGCNADGGYLNYLAADDDNGNLEDGTPHMTAIHAAFARHGIACSALQVQDSGCSGTPTTAPVVNAVPLDKAVKLSWAPVAGAARYEVFRTEGVFGCDFGKIKVGETTDTEFVVDGLRNGFEVYFTVAAAGSGPTCLGPMSACTPAAAAAGGPGLVIDKASFESAIRSGDGDLFLDNCERAELRFDFRNSGSAALTNPRVIAVRSPSHPATTTVTPLPAVVSPSIPVCGEGQAAVEILAGGLANDEVLQIEVEMTSDELAAAGVSRTVTFELRTTEGDFQFFPSRKFDFESGLGMWRRLHGTFDPASDGGGADTAAYLASSSFADSACDVSATPLVRLTATSTVGLWSNFDIEPDTVGGAAGWDRANVRLREHGTGTQTVVQPSSGRGYNVLPGSAGEFSGACGDMALEPGWGGPMPTWASSSFTAADLGSAETSGAPLQVVVQYGTDAAAPLRGFWLDEVEVTNAEVEVPDTQGDVCRAPCSELDDNAPAIEYTGGWHRKEDATATGGGYHERAGNNKKGAAVRVVFDGDEITYLYGVSQAGGTADILIDGVLRETLSYQGAGAVSFGRAVTYADLEPGRHELRIVHRSGKVTVDGFRINCDGAGGADASAPQFRSRTEVFTASAGGGPVIVRQVQAGPQDVALSVVVEGLGAPLTVQLLGPLGTLVAQGGALIPGLSLSGLDAPVTPGTYKVQFPNTVAPGQTVRISIAHTERVP